MSIPEQMSSTTAFSIPAFGPSTSYLHRQLNHTNLLSLMPSLAFPKMLPNSKQAPPNAMTLFCRGSGTHDLNPAYLSFFGVPSFIVL